MERLKSIYARAAKRHGGPRGVEANLAKPKSRAALKRTPDDRVLAEMTKAVFRAGFVWRVIEAKWDGFETVFDGFDPAKCRRYSENKLAKFATDERIVRNPQKIAAVRENARLCHELSEEHGSVGACLASWPTEDMVGLWDLLKRRGSRLGGNTGPYVLRTLGVDTPILSKDVTAALRKSGVIDTANPSSKRALQEIQAAFNAWRNESGRSLTEISRVLALSIDG